MVALGILVVGPMVLAGCFPVGRGGYSSAAGPVCDYKTDCEIGATCFDGQCVKSCSSDYSCGYGNLCQKAGYSTQGICVVPTNAYGGREFVPPRSNSFGPGNGGGCSFKTDCSIGFKCVKSGSIYGTCIKKTY